MPRGDAKFPGPSNSGYRIYSGYMVRGCILSKDIWCGDAELSGSQISCDIGFDLVGRGHVNGALRAVLGFDQLYYCPYERGLTLPAPDNTVDN